MVAKVSDRHEDVIVSRTFTVRRGSQKTAVVLRVLRPTREPTGDYRCIYELRAGRKVLRRSPGICGVDGVQSLLLALSIIAIEVERIARDLGGSVEAWQLADLRALAASTAAAHKSLIRQLKRRRSRSAS